MNNKKVLLILILVFIIVIASAYVLYTKLGSSVETQQIAVVQREAPAAAEEQPEDEKANDIMAPDFTVYDAQGNQVHLYDYLGKPVVLNFWASWCGPCQMEMPDFNEKYLELGDEVQFLMINVTDGNRETIESASRFIEENGYSFPVFYDTTTEAAGRYGVYSLPMSYFIDREGNAIARVSGAISGETLQKCLDLIM